MIRIARLAGFSLASVLGLGALAAPNAAFAAGSIKGAVKLTGKAPEPKELNMKSDPFCAKQTGVKDEEVVVGKKGELKNVVVRIAKGAPAGEQPKDNVVIDQQGCSYKPRVSVAVAGQQVLIKNSDQTLHNVHTYKGPATLFNQAQPQGFPELKKKFPTPGDQIKFKCDVHPWMTGWLVVTDNTFFAVTGDDGAFELKNLPAGSYTVEAWHEKFGSKTQEVKVTDGKPTELKLDFTAK